MQYVEDFTLLAEGNAHKASSKGYRKIFVSGLKLEEFREEAYETLMDVVTETRIG